MRITLASLLLLATTPALAVDRAEVIRIDDAQVTVRWEDKDAIEVWLADTANAPLKSARKVASGKGNGEAVVPLPAGKRGYVLIRDKGDRSVTTVAERVLPLQQGSNFRDLGGYTGAGGRRVHWGRIFRSGAMPLLSERDYAMLGGLGISSIVDLRSTDERQVAPTALDDRTGALFISNDYGMKGLMAAFAAKGDDTLYGGIEKTLAPQYRAIFRRLLANDGATLYNCSAGQDRTGIASALILSALGVDRKTILEDYHLSTPTRRLEWEMPKVDPKDFPGNPIVQYYVAAADKPGPRQAEPLYTKSGQSHLVQFFAYIDKSYGSVEGYLDKELGIGPADIAQLRLLYLQ